MFSWSNEWFHIFGFKPITKGKHRNPKLLFEVFITIIFGICQLVINWLAQLLTWLIGLIQLIGTFWLTCILLIQLIGTIWLIDSTEWHYLIDLYYWLIQLIGLGPFDWLVWLIDTIRLIDSTDWQYIWLIFLFNYYPKRWQFTMPTVRLLTLFWILVENCTHW